MEGSGACKKCRKKSLVRDDESSCLVCSSCGIVQDFDDFQAHFGGFGGPQGTFVRVGTSGVGSSLAYKDKKIFEAQKTIDDIMLKMGFSGSRSNEVKLMVDRITEGEYGLGYWFPILVGACAYVVMRKDNKSLPMAEVAPVIGCDIYELGRMISRVVDFLDLKLPEIDIVNLFERAIRKCPSFTRVSVDKVERMLKQGTFLLQCAVKWFLTSGRMPLPMVAAVLVFVAELNQVDVSIEDVAKEVHAAVRTSKRRYKELLQTLVKVAGALPWGKDITIKNIVKNAPLVIRYIEMKSMLKPGEKGKNLHDVGFCLEDVVSDCLSKKSEYVVNDNGVENDSQGSKEDNRCSFSRLSDDNLEKCKVSHECLSTNYSKFLNEISHMKSLEESGDDLGQKGGNNYEFSACEQWWTGKSELCKKLYLKKILEKDVGFDALPPSFVTSCLVKEKRKEKIKAAKLRVNKIMHPSDVDLGDMGGDSCFLDSAHAGKKRKKAHDSINCEDLIIESLLLHQVEEEEIEKGNYSTLLALHVFNSGVV